MTLRGLRQAGPFHDCEILLVDNGSTDGTAAVVEEWRAVLPIRPVLESRRGLSHARNRAVQEARGEFLLFLDDDVLVCPGWLDAYRHSFAAHPAAAFFGGPIRPRFLGTPPAWLLQSMPLLDSAFAARDFGADEFALSTDRLPFGANMAFRRTALERHRFDPALGRSGKGMRAGEESALMTDMLAAGECGWWVPGAVIEHLMPAERQTTRYVRGYYRGLGETNALAEGPQPRGRFEVMGAPSWLWRRLVAESAAYLLARCTKPPVRWMEHLIRLARDRGLLDACRQARADHQMEASTLKRPPRELD